MSLSGALRVLGHRLLSSWSVTGPAPRLPCALRGLSSLSEGQGGRASAAVPSSSIAEGQEDDKLEGELQGTYFYSLPNSVL